MACLSRRWAKRDRGVCRRTTTAIHRAAGGRASTVSRCLPVSPFGDIFPDKNAISSSAFCPER
uniref:Uncharacterized protein n=1 Tax=Oryza barthii TaxID=65489 RepID=A0A0D3GET3_9ORYZ